MPILLRFSTFHGGKYGAARCCFEATFRYGDGVVNLNTPSLVEPAISTFPFWLGTKMVLATAAQTRYRPADPAARYSS